MQRVALLLCAVAAVSAVIVETNTDAPIMIPRAGDAPVMTRAFVARGGRAAQLELTTLLIDDKPVARVRHVEGDLTGSETEVVITLTSLSSRRVRDWFREYVDAQYKKHDVSIVTKTKDTGAGSTTDAPLSFSKHILKGSLITEITFPSFGVTDGTVKVKLLYSSSEEVKNVKAVPVAEAPIRTEFFKLSLKNGDKDKAGAAMAKSVFRLGGFSLIRVKGFGKSSPTKIGAFFRAGSDRASALSRWNDWYTSKESHYVGGGGVTTKSRDGSIVLYYWSGSTMDATMGESSRGQLKKLFELKLKDITLSAMDSNEGRVTLSVDTIEMAEH